MADLYGDMSMFWNLSFLFNSLELCDKKYLIFVDSCDKILLNSSWKALWLAKGLLNKFFKTHFIKFYLNS